MKGKREEKDEDQNKRKRRRNTLFLMWRPIIPTVPSSPCVSIMVQRGFNWTPFTQRGVRLNCSAPLQPATSRSMEDCI